MFGNLNSITAGFVVFLGDCFNRRRRPLVGSSTIDRTIDSIDDRFLEFGNIEIFIFIQ